MDDVEPLLRAIRLGEVSRVELKTVVVAGRSVKGPKRDDMADELAAFANSRGPDGLVILGVDDRAQ